MYPIGEGICQLINKIHAKPFDRDFDIQLGAAQELYGNHPELFLTNQDIERAFDEVSEYYSAEIISKTKDRQMNLRML